MDYLLTVLPLFSPPFLCPTLCRPIHPLVQQRVVGTIIKHQPPPMTRAWLPAKLCKARKSNNGKRGREGEEKKGKSFFFLFFLEGNKRSSLEINLPSRVLASRDSTFLLSLCEVGAAFGLQFYGWETKDQRRTGEEQRLKRNPTEISHTRYCYPLKYRVSGPMFWFWSSHQQLLC